MIVYELESKNLTGLGGPMGTDHTTTNWTALFMSVKSAKRLAEKDYKMQKSDGDEDIKWRRVNDNDWQSQDLRYVMYTISPKKLRK